MTNRQLQVLLITILMTNQGLSFEMADSTVEELLKKFRLDAVC